MGPDAQEHIWTSRKKPKQQEQGASASCVGARDNEQKSFLPKKGRHSERVPELEARDHLHEPAVGGRHHALNAALPQQ